LGRRLDSMHEMLDRRAGKRAGRLDSIQGMLDIEQERLIRRGGYAAIRQHWTERSRGWTASRRGWAARSRGWRASWIN
jgi:hypothetical protein